MTRKNPKPANVCTKYVRIGMASVLCLVMACVSEAAQLVEDEEPVRGPREMLKVMRIDDSQLQVFQDDRAVDNDERETLLQLLYRLPTFSQVDIETWTKPIDDWPRLIAHPHENRFELFELRGIVKSIRAIDVLPEIAPRLRFAKYYELHIDCGSRQVTAMVRTIPAAWVKHLQAGNQIANEGVRLSALLLKRDETQRLVFAAPRVNWYPLESNPSLGTSDDHVLLGQLGLDIGRLEEVEHKRAIGGHDRECFYQMLSAVRHANSGQLAKLGRADFDIARMIKTPEKVVGELYTLSGRARRAVLIRVEDEDIQQRFGIDHYYEIEVFLPLEKNVRFVDQDDPEGKLFTDFPFVICVPDLPLGMDAGDDIHVPVSFSGFFLKTWAYRTQFMSAGKARTARPNLQLSPLLIGPTVVPEPNAPAMESYLGLGLAVFFTVTLFVLWLVLWRLSIQDRKFAKTKLYEKLRMKPEALRRLDKLE